MGPCRREGGEEPSGSGSSGSGLKRQVGTAADEEEPPHLSRCLPPLAEKRRHDNSMEESEPPHISRCLPPDDDEAAQATEAAAATSDAMMPDTSLLNSDMYLMGVEMGLGINDLLYSVFGTTNADPREEAKSLGVSVSTLRSAQEAEMNISVR